MTNTQKTNVLNTLKADGELFIEKHMRKGILTTHEFTCFIVLSKIKELNKENLKSLKIGIGKALENVKDKSTAFYLKRDLYGVNLLIESL